MVDFYQLIDESKQMYHIKIKLDLVAKNIDFIHFYKMWVTCFFSENGRYITVAFLLIESKESRLYIKHFILKLNEY